MSLGIGVMLGFLSGNADTVAAYKAAIGKTISTVAMDHGEPEKLVINFEGGSRLIVMDDGQSCCESRYMTCDDDLTVYGGSVMQDIEVRDGPEHKAGEYGDEHEEQFLVVTTSQGSFTVATHNEHNGYYGGFWIKLSFEEA